jgi:hypothetical protein
VAGVDGRARRIGAVRRVGGRAAVLGEHRRLRRQQGRDHQSDHPARRGARAEGPRERGGTGGGQDPLRRRAVRGSRGRGGR